jgi:hypothetical protein
MLPPTRAKAASRSACPRPATRLIARLFLDPGAFARAYLADLTRHLAKDTAP